VDLSRGIGVIGHGLRGLILHGAEMRGGGFGTRWMTRPAEISRAFKDPRHPVEETKALRTRSFIEIYLQLQNNYVDNKSIILAF